MNSPNDSVVIDINDTILENRKCNYNPYVNDEINKDDQELLKQLQKDMNFIDNYVSDLENQLNGQPTVNHEYTQTEPDKSVFDKICGFFGIDGIVTSIMEKMPTKEEMKQKFKSCIIYKIFNFLF